MHQIVLEITGVANGRQILNQRLARVRVGDSQYRPAKSPDFDAALRWLQAQGYKLAQAVKPKQKAGTVTARYFYRKE